MCFKEPPYRTGYEMSRWIDSPEITFELCLGYSLNLQLKFHTSFPSFRRYQSCKALGERNRGPSHVN
jgi:hypothetical protein